MAQYKVAIDAGHGGSDPGAVYNGRQEKDDVLRLAMAVGKILENSGVDVFYVRDDDTYETPFKKATDANNSGADLFVSLHRNSSEVPNQYSGVETLVYADGGTRSLLANNINSELSAVGFNNLGIDERPNLVVLKRTKMPAVLIEAGFINSDADNRIFDDNFNKIAQGIADGILTTMYQTTRQSRQSRPVSAGASMTDSVESPAQPASAQTVRPVYEDPANNVSPSEMHDSHNMADNRNTPDGSYTKWGCDCENINGSNPQFDKLYRVQVGAFRNKESADRMLNSLLIEGFPAFIVYDDGIYKVQVGAYGYLSNAIKMEKRLRRFRYNTYITT